MLCLLFPSPVSHGFIVVVFGLGELPLICDQLSKCTTETQFVDCNLYESVSQTP
jgi:hypothetical protein